MILYQAEREQVAYFMRRLYRQYLTTTSGGNISCRTADGNIIKIHTLSSVFLLDYIIHLFINIVNKTHIKAEKRTDIDFNLFLV